MFSPAQYDGSLLPDKTLCLTFDDGPGETAGTGRGPKTIKLAEYLYNEGIPATFFMVGRHIAQYPQLPQQVLYYGHIIGNHTYNHPDFTKPKTFKHGLDMVAEIKQTEDLISQFYPNKNVFFRAPYGSWDVEIAATLNQNLSTDINYIGPIGWDINENDWLFWLNELSAKDCADTYLKKIIEIGHGIIVMHDSTSDHDTMRLNNLTFEAVKLLIPQLKHLGYSFVGLQNVPGIKVT